MNIYLKRFLHRGFMFGGLGPIVLGIIYAILERTIQGFSLSGLQVFIAIVSTYILAFLQAGVSVFNQIEHWPIAKSLFCHFSILYIAYIFCYLINSWISFKFNFLIIFTTIFICGYFLIWGIVYVTVKSISKKMNRMLN